MSERVVVREMTQDDIDRVDELYAELDRLHSDSLPWLFQTSADRARSPAFFEEILRAADSTILVAEPSGAVVGYAYVVMRSASDVPILRPRRWGELVDLHVAGGSRLRGVGTRLMCEVERWTSAAGGDSVELNVYDFNDGAVAFFRSVGYGALASQLRKPLEVEGDGIGWPSS